MKLEEVEESHPLASCRGASNLVVVTLRDGRTIELRGTGASRWQTAESVMGDVLALARERRKRTEDRRQILGEFEAVAS